MALTRVQIETILLKRVGALLTEASLDTSSDGANADLNDPIGYALRQLGGTVADVTAVADGDLANVDADDYDELFDIAEWRALSNLEKHLTRVNIKAGPLSANYSELAERVHAMATAKRAELENDYGFGVAEIEAGVVTLDVLLKDRDIEFSN